MSVSYFVWYISIGKSVSPVLMASIFSIEFKPHLLPTFFGKIKVLQLLRRIFLDPRSSATCAAVLPKTVRFGRLPVTGGRSDLSPHASHALWIWSICRFDQSYWSSRDAIGFTCHSLPRWRNPTGRGMSFDDLLQHDHGNQITDQDKYNRPPITSALPHLHITYANDPNL